MPHTCRDLGLHLQWHQYEYLFQYVLLCYSYGRSSY